MTKKIGLPATPTVGSAMPHDSLAHVRMIPRPRLTHSRQVSKRMAILGMAVGYLGLVAVLAAVPVWSQALMPYQNPVAACPDFGGSR